MRYAQLAAAAAHVLPDGTKRGTLDSRMKQLQKMGIPRGVNVGRGAKVDYTIPQALDALLTLELSVLGVTPQIGFGLIDANREAVDKAVAAKRVLTICPNARSSSAIKLDVPRLMDLIEREEVA